MSQTLRWWKIRFELYRQIRRQVEARLGGYDSEMIKYQSDYESTLKKTWKKVPKEKMLNRLAKSDVVLIGDFHVLAQSQRSALRILRHLVKERAVVLGLECFRPEQGAMIKSYLKGSLTDSHFLKRTKWQERWGFSWSPYKSLLTWAKVEKVPVFGLDSLLGAKTKASLAQRDRRIAAEIRRQRALFPDAVLVILIGDWHLANSHLPRFLPESIGEVSRVFQNDENIYFDLLKKNRDHEVDVVQLGPWDFCLMTVAPWVKWQSYQLFLDANVDSALDDVADESESSEIDPTDSVLQILDVLARELGIQVERSQLAIYSPQDRHFWEKILANYSRAELRWVETIIQNEFSFYFDKAGVGLLIRPTINHVASLAMQVLHASLQDSSETDLKFPLFFENLIWIETFRYFGSKLLNPKRKTDSVEELKIKIHSESFNTKEAMLVALAQRVVELKRLNSKRNIRLKYKPKFKESFFNGAWVLGRIHGERLYQIYRSGDVSAKQILAWMRVTPPSVEWQKSYEEFLRSIERVSLHKVKTQRL